MKILKNFDKDQFKDDFPIYMIVFLWCFVVTPIVVAYTIKEVIYPSGNVVSPLFFLGL